MKQKGLCRESTGVAQCYFILVNLHTLPLNYVFFTSFLTICGPHRVLNLITCIKISKL